MTIDKLLSSWTAEQFKKATDAELLEYFKPYLSVTRPELAQKPVDNKHTKTLREPSKMQKIDAKMQRMQQLAKQLGIDL